MTDTFDSKPQDPQEEKPVDEEPAPVEPGLAQESQDTATEDAVTEAPSDEEQNYEFSDKDLPEDQAGTEPVRRSAFLPIAAAVGGVLLLGSVAWWQLTGGTSFSLPPSITKASSGGLSLPPLSSTPAETKSVAALPAPAEPKTDSALQKDAVVSADSSSDASSSVRPSLLDAPFPQAKPVESIPQNAPVAAIPAPVVETTPTPISALPAPLNAAPAPIPAPTVDDHKSEMLNARVDSLQKALDQANQQVSQMTAALAAASSTQASIPAVTKEMQAKIDSLEQKLAAANRVAAAPVTGPAAAPVAATTSTTVEETAPAPKVETVAPAKPKAPHKVAHKTSKPVTTKASRGLVLRAVASGHAWIAKSATASELTEVMVGDRVSGLGTVTSIEERGGKWIVRGTKGAIQ